MPRLRVQVGLLSVGDIMICLKCFFNTECNTVLSNQIFDATAYGISSTEGRIKDPDVSNKIVIAGTNFWIRGGLVCIRDSELWITDRVRTQFTCPKCGFVWDHLEGDTLNMEHYLITGPLRFHLIFWPIIAFILGTTLCVCFWAHQWKVVRMAEMGFISKDVPRQEGHAIWEKLDKKE